MSNHRDTFDDWMKKVDQAVESLVGVSAQDLADYCYRDAYDSGASAKATAKRAIRADQGQD